MLGQAVVVMVSFALLAEEELSVPEAGLAGLFWVGLVDGIV